MEIKDLVGLSEPLSRLIDVISKGVGSVSQPYLIKQLAKARAEEIKIISSALKEVSDKQHLPVVYKNGEVQVWQKPEDKTLVFEHSDVDERSASRTDYKERKRQNNLESVTSVAAAELINEKDVPDEAPDEDWVTRFFDSAQDVSSDQMQDLWGRILAGEIKKPGTYSLKSLDLIRNLSKDDASLIEKMGKFSIKSNGTPFIVAFADKWLETERGIYERDQFEMAELGLIYPTTLQLTKFSQNEINQELFIYGDHLMLIDRGELTQGVPLPIWKYTSIGEELLELVPSQYDEEYLEQIGHFFIGKKAEASIAKILKKLPNGQIQYDLIRKIEKNNPE